MTEQEIKIELETVRQLIRGLRTDVNDLKRFAEGIQARQADIDSISKLRWDVDALQVKMKKIEGAEHDCSQKKD